MRITVPEKPQPGERAVCRGVACTQALSSVERCIHVHSGNNLRVPNSNRQSGLRMAQKMNPNAAIIR
jgi:hypothetical protein